MAFLGKDPLLRGLEIGVSIPRETDNKEYRAMISASVWITKLADVEE